MSENENIIVLTGQDGSQTRFEFMDLIDYLGKQYVVLYPVDEDGGEVVIMQVDDDNSSDEESYLEVNDDSIVQAVFNIFKEKNKDSYDFTDSDSSAAKSNGKKMKCRSRFALLLISWIGAWAGLHLNWLGYREAASDYRRRLGGIFALINPVAWIMHIVEIFKILFGGYREDAYGRPVRYLSFLHKAK